MAESFKTGLKGLQLFFFIMAVPFLIAGILAFRQASEWGEVWKQKKALVDSGEVAPLQATVAGKSRAPPRMASLGLVCR